MFNRCGKQDDPDYERETCYSETIEKTAYALTKDQGMERDRCREQPVERLYPPLDRIETGSIEEAEKSSVIAMRPGIRVPGGAFFPIANARNMKNGKRIPITMMFGLM